MPARAKKKSPRRPASRAQKPAPRALKEKQITFTVALTALPGEEDALAAEARRLIRPTRAERGCVQYILHRSKEQPGQFLFYEIWASREALERHWQSPHFLRWKERQGALLETIERAFWDPIH